MNEMADKRTSEILRAFNPVPTSLIRVPELRVTITDPHLCTKIFTEGWVELRVQIAALLQDWQRRTSFDKRLAKIKSRPNDPNFCIETNVRRNSWRQSPTGIIVQVTPVRAGRLGLDETASLLFSAFHDCVLPPVRESSFDLSVKVAGRMARLVFFGQDGSFARSCEPPEHWKTIFNIPFIKSQSAGDKNER